MIRKKGRLKAQEGAFLSAARGVRFISAARLSDEQGYSFVEVIIALAIIACAIPALLHLVPSNSERSARTTARLRATLAAEAILDRVGLDFPLRIQNVSGQFKDGSQWRVEIKPHLEVGLSFAEETKTYAIEVVVTPRRWPADAVALKSLRILGLPL